MSLDFELSCYILSIPLFARSVWLRSKSPLNYITIVRLFPCFGIIHQKDKADKLVIIQQQNLSLSAHLSEELIDVWCFCQTFSTASGKRWNCRVNTYNREDPEGLSDMTHCCYRETKMFVFFFQWRCTPPVFSWECSWTAVYLYFLSFLWKLSTQFQKELLVELSRF